MVYRILADAVMLIHFGFLVFLAIGGFLACRIYWIIVPHLAAAAWGALSALVGVECPLTAWEDSLRRLGEGHGLPHGFIDTYLTGVIYPSEHLRVMQLLLVVLVATSWLRFATTRYGHTRPPAPVHEPADTSDSTRWDAEIREPEPASRDARFGRRARSLLQRDSTTPRSSNP